MSLYKAISDFEIIVKTISKSLLFEKKYFQGAHAQTFLCPAHFLNYIWTKIMETTVLFAHTK